MMASRVADSVSTRRAPLSANPSTKCRCLRARAAMMSSAYSYADAVQHRRVLAPHALPFGPLETRGVQLPVVQDLDLLLSGQGGVMDHRIGGLEHVGWIVQGLLQIDLTHLNLRAGRRGRLLPNGAEGPAQRERWSIACPMPLLPQA